MSILIKNGIIKGESKDLYIEDNTILQIQDLIERDADTVIDARRKAIIPALLNSHTHAAMTLFRGYGDDMKLHDWLNSKIWPLEAKLTEEDVYWGAKLACLEMIKSGTTFFNDMYWHWHGTVKAVLEMGLRACVAGVFIDLFDEDKAAQQIKRNQELLIESKGLSDRIQFCLGPHAIYTVSERSLRWAKDFADEHQVLIHIHLSETEEEVKNCVAEHRLRPVEYLNKINFLGPNLVVAHALWLDDKELDILEDHDVKVVTNPCANLKLATGVFPYSCVVNRGITIGLGTDGVASNNNFDLFEEMKFLALLEKSRTFDPTAAAAHDVFRSVTEYGSKIFSLNSGSIEEGKLADLILLDLSQSVLVPGHDLVSDLVYSANGSVVDSVICDGKILMSNRKVEGEEEIVEKAKEIAFGLIRRH